MAAGRQVYAGHCASCHGADLQGQPDWQTRLPNGRMPAPPHDASGHTGTIATTELFTIVKKGVSAIVPGYESDMPGFDGVLTDDANRGRAGLHQEHMARSRTRVSGATVTTANVAGADLRFRSSMPSSLDSDVHKHTRPLLPHVDRVCVNGILTRPADYAPRAGRDASAVADARRTSARGQTRSLGNDKRPFRSGYQTLDFIHQVAARVRTSTAEPPCRGRCAF